MPRRTIYQDSFATVQSIRTYVLVRMLRRKGHEQGRVQMPRRSRVRRGARASVTYQGSAGLLAAVVACTAACVTADGHPQETTSP